MTPIETLLAKCEAALIEIAHPQPQPERWTHDMPYKAHRSVQVIADEVLRAIAEHRAKGVPDEGELWSSLRRVIDQVTAMRQDYLAGRLHNYEHLQARLDEAARERLPQFLQLLVAAPQPTIPLGWQLVPEAPTKEMIAAGWIDKEDVNPDDIWASMLAAAPQPQEPKP